MDTQSRQVVFLPRQLLSVPPRKVVLILLSQEAVQVLFPREASANPKSGRNIGSAGTHSQAGSTSPQAGSVRSSQPGESAGSTGTLAEAGSSTCHSSTPCVFHGSPQK